MSLVLIATGDGELIATRLTAGDSAVNAWLLTPRHKDEKRFI
jgi:hypothetical protein